MVFLYLFKAYHLDTSHSLHLSLNSTLCYECCCRIIERLAMEGINPVLFACTKLSRGNFHPRRPEYSLVATIQNL